MHKEFCNYSIKVTQWLGHMIKILVMTYTAVLCLLVNLQIPKIQSTTFLPSHQVTALELTHFAHSEPAIGCNKKV